MSSYENAFIFTDDVSVIERGKNCNVATFTVATNYPERFNLEGVTAYKIVKTEGDVVGDFLFLPSLTDEKTVDAVIDKVLGDDAKLIVSACYSLDEIGLIDVKYHLSPVQLLHKLGLLEKCTVVGGVYLDRDDVDLMSQCGTPLVLCPTSSMGYGYGIPHFCAYENKLNVKLGSGDNRFNCNGDMIAEARALVLGVNSEMRGQVLSAEKAIALIGGNAHNAYRKLFG
jgi:cytosine/adenosine deaminase-related metal-dependent hydrolase